MAASPQQDQYRRQRAATRTNMDGFHPAVREWFDDAFPEPTAAQSLGWPAIASGDSTLILAPTGSGKTLAAFLWCIDRLMFPGVGDRSAPETKGDRCRVLYISPLKALAVDVERNLRMPIAGISRVAATRGDAHVIPAVAIRTGDTPADERARFQRDPADILITTPESLYLLLTSNARDAMRSIETVIVDEVHALVPTKRGTHLALSLERLEALCGRPVQRIGLSATQRPLDEVARFLGGAVPGGTGPSASAEAAAHSPEPSRTDQSIHDEFATEAQAQYRAVTIVDTRERKQLELSVEVPVEDMARIGEPVDIPSGPASQGAVRSSIWTAIHPRLLELVRSHTSTLIFVNNRRTAERLAAALNDLAGETLVRSHHGSLARPQRIEVEDRLKAGLIRGLVATSSLELGIDMGAIDLVIQVEAPPSVASGMQRIGRAGHHAGATSEGIVFPKFRGDLVACAAVAEAMHDGHIEAIRYPRNPLDVLAQQIVAMVAMDRWNIDELFATIRRAAPFATLSRRIFEGVLDMLAGRYPSDEFAELRPRVTWDRDTGLLTAREGARRVAVVNGGTIPDRGLYGVFLADSARGAVRVGELDEEMVFESRVGETFLLGASTWRIEQITHDRVLVTPAPGEPGKMPFWKGDAAGRPQELGRAIGRLIRDVRAVPAPAMLQRLVERHDLEPRAAENLLQYVNDQLQAAQAVPDDRTILIERYRDELGDWRVCLLSPLGGRVHAPWSMAIAARVRDELGVDVETMWTDDGIVVRFPDTDAPPDSRLMLPEAADAERLVLRQLGATALFAAKFREAAARALLLPRRRPGGRTPLWHQRKRASDLLAVAARFGSFPMLLEAYRECLRDVFDMPALGEVLRGVADRDIRVVTIDSETPTPFASSLLFGYVANNIYDGDAPLAERRAQALAIDQAQLRELLGEAELRELLDVDALTQVERELQHLEPRLHAKSADSVHDLLLRLGDLSDDELRARSTPAAVAALPDLERARRVMRVRVAGAERVIAVEDVARYRDALGAPVPRGVPESLLQPVADPRRDLALRYGRTHGPFTSREFADRYGLMLPVADALLHAVAATGRLLHGEFRPRGTHVEWCDAEVLRAIRRRSLAKLRQEVEPVAPEVLARLHARWQGVARPRTGLDALLDAIDTLQGTPVAASVLESEILAARIADYNPGDLDTLAAAGEVVWCGVEPLGERDGRVALFLTDHLRRLWRPRTAPDELPARERALLETLSSGGALFFSSVHEAAGGGYPGETLDALWNLAWMGLVTNDTFHSLRSFARPPVRKRRERGHPGGFRSRRVVPPGGEGRWSLVTARLGTPVSPTEWSTATARQLLARYGIVTRENAAAESLPGGFSAVYDVLKAMEEAGRVQRGYFVGGVSAVQFGSAPAIELLRSLRDAPDAPEVIHVSATDPANPYGSVVKWPPDQDASHSTQQDSAARGPIRVVGASVILVDGRLAAYLGRNGRPLLVWLPEDEPDRSRTMEALARRLGAIGRTGERRSGGLLIPEINGAPAASHPLASALVDAGFVPSAMGFYVRREPDKRETRAPIADGEY